MKTYTLPLFPLNLVIFPNGLLPLRIFEARYLDMIKACIRNNTLFGVVAVYPNANPPLNDMPQNTLPFAKVGTTFSIIDSDFSQPGLIMIRCLGHHRFRVKSASQQADGLWLGEVEDMANDVEIEIPEDLLGAKIHMQKLIDAILAQGVSEIEMPIGKPYHLDDCAWVANRWCELISMPLAQKQMLLELDSPLVRLELIHDILNNAHAEN
jgi:uncharacterized protein